MIRKKAIIYLCSLAIATAAFSAGCTRLSEGSDNSDVSFEANAENLEEGSVAKAENCVKNFINAINTQNFDGIADMIYLPENAFVSDKNVEWYLQRSGVSDITGVKIKNFDVEISDGALTKDATVYINKSGYQFSLAMDADNQWKIVMNDMFVENWSLKVPKGCTITVDGVDVDQYKIPATAIDVYDTYMTKRIIGIPGDKVSIQNGIVYINEQPVTESYLSPDVHTLPLNGRNYFEVPDSSYFVLGDNREHSYDSRAWDDPYVPIDHIAGKVLCVFSLHPVSYRGVTEIAIEPIHSGAPAYDPDNIVTEATGTAAGTDSLTPDPNSAATLPVETIAPEDVTEPVTEEETSEEASGETAAAEESSADSETDSTAETE